MTVTPQKGDSGGTVANGIDSERGERCSRFKVRGSSCDHSTRESHLFCSGAKAPGSALCLTHGRSTMSVYWGEKKSE